MQSAGPWLRRRRAEEEEARALDRVIEAPPAALAGEIDRRANPVIVPIVVEDVRFTKSWRAGEGRLRANHTQADHGADGRFRSERAEAPVEQQPGTQAGSGLFMCLAAVLLAASALTSLTLLWFAIRGIQWLLLR